MSFDKTNPKEKIRRFLGRCEDGNRMDEIVWDCAQEDSDANVMESDAEGLELAVFCLDRTAHTLDRRRRSPA